MDQASISRINELSRLAKARPLTTDEQAERTRLRAAYLQAFRASARQTLEGTLVEYPDGSRKTLKEHNDSMQ